MMFVIAGLFKLSVGLVFGVAVLLVIVMPFVPCVVKNGYTWRLNCNFDEIFANNNQSVYYISCFSFKCC